MSPALRKPATLRDTTEADALREENAQLREALAHIRDVAATAAMHAKSPTTAANYVHLSGLASDALEPQ